MHEWQHLFLGRLEVVEEPCAVVERAADANSVKHLIFGLLDLFPEQDAVLVAHFLGRAF